MSNDKEKMARDLAMLDLLIAENQENMDAAQKQLDTALIMNEAMDGFGPGDMREERDGVVQMLRGKLKASRKTHAALSDKRDADRESAGEAVVQAARIDMILRNKRTRLSKAEGELADATVLYAAASRHSLNERVILGARKRMEDVQSDVSRCREQVYVLEQERERLLGGVPERDADESTRRLT